MVALLITVLHVFIIIHHLFKAIVEALKDPEFGELLLLTIFTILSGGLFYHHVEGWSFLDSFYFSVITLTTIGYGDLAPTTELSKFFTILYIFVGLGIILGFINRIARHAYEAQSHHVNKIQRKLGHLHHRFHKEEKIKEPIKLKEKDFLENPASIISDIEEEYKLARKEYATRWEEYTKGAHEKIVGELSGSNKKIKILDLGCGTGDLLLELRRTFPKANLYGIDKSSTMIDLAKEKLEGIENVTLICEKIEDISFTKSDFDLIISTSVLHYLDIDVVLSKAHEILKKDGTFIFADYVNQGLSRMLAWMYRSLHSGTKDYTPKQIEQKLVQWGFEAESIKKYHFSHHRLMKIKAKKV